MNGSNEIYKYASFKERFLTLSIDFLTIMAGIGLLFGVWFTLGLLILSFFASGDSPDNINIDKFISVLLLIILLVGFDLWQRAFRRSGQTLGAKLMRIKVVPARGNKLGILVPVYWLLLSAPHFALICSCRVGFERRQSVLDIMSGTYTIKVEHDKERI